MVQPVEPALTPEEQAQVMDIQDRLIELLVGRGEAVSGGDQARADALQDEIDDLLQQRDDIRMWATADGK
jgi:ribosome assembly protein YihI (activator of Der GTPase)